MVRFRLFVTLLVLLGVVACSSSPPAPVLERSAGQNQNAKASSTKVAKNKSSISSKDWRPDTYTVKKGDTLYSIGLEFGYDYKEVAAANSITAPYGIKVGQQLKFTPLKDKADSTKLGEVKPAEVKNHGAVVITPIKTEPTTAASTPKIPLIITEPKAIREPYSIDAMNKPIIVATPAKLTETKAIDIKPADTIKPHTDVKPETKPDNKTDVATDEDQEWIWPTNGKVVTSFNEGNNKGIDIAGLQGQAINASAAGKVIYSGSDLRGYGKLVIIKHNKTYLSVYAHNSRILVKEGQQVSRGQKIAEMGNTDSDKVALHFEIRQQGKSVDPTKFVTQ